MAFQQVLHTLYFTVTLPPWGMEVMFLARKDCGEIDGQSSVGGYDVAEFNLSNGLLSLTFDSNNHLANWSTVSNSNDRRSTPLKTHSLYQAYFHYNESVTPRKSSATYGAYIYSFYPISTSKEPITPTPSVTLIISPPTISSLISLSLKYSPSMYPFVSLSSLFRHQ